MYGDRAFELIKELARSKDSIPPFDENGIRQIVEEMKALFQQNQKEFSLSIDESIQYHPGIHLRHAALERNKQCLLAYLYNRLVKIQKTRWTFGSILPTQVRANITEQEFQYFQNYNKNLANYMRTLNLDLTQDVKPPKSIMIEVRVLRDYGEFEIENGELINLKKDSTHYLPRAQCEILIRQGIVEVV